MTAMIEVQGLTKRYGSKRGITDVSFQVEEGEVFGFLGPNGAGKTTTIRFAALGSATVFIGVITLLASAGAAAAAGLKLDAGNLAAATLGMIPLALLIAAIGYLASGWLRTAADTGLLSFVLLILFFIRFIGPELQLPNATLRLSPFYYYGSPLLHGLAFTSVVGLVAVAAVALALGALRFVRKDIGV